MTDSDLIEKDKNKYSSLTINFIYISPPIMITILAKADSVSLRHHFKNEDKGVLLNMKSTMNQVVNIPNNEVMTSSFKVKI